MTLPLTINQALERLNALDGQPVELEGILDASHGGGYELLHYPKVERATSYDRNDSRYRSALWLAFGDGSLRPNHEALSRWCGKRVRVHGVIRTVNPHPELAGFFGSGFGPWGNWPAEVESFILQRVSADARRDVNSAVSP